jgi:hypothetical protein
MRTVVGFVVDVKLPVVKQAGCIVVIGYTLVRELVVPIDVFQR